MSYSTNRLLLPFLFILALFSCSDNDVAPAGSEKSDLINIDGVIDFENQESASDLRLFLRMKNSTRVDEIRMFITDSQRFSRLTPDDIADLDEDEYNTIQLSMTENEVVPTTDLRDINGVVMVHGRAYILAFAVTVHGEMFIDKNFRSFTLADEHFLAGEYIGTWTDNLYTDFGISAKLSYAHGKLSGPFYYTGAFVSCCSGATDGTITIEFEDDQITEFRYDQTLASFMGGQCDGTYTGFGRILRYSALDIDFDGADCEGAHFDGKIKLVK